MVAKRAQWKITSGVASTRLEDDALPPGTSDVWVKKRARWERALLERASDRRGSICRGARAGISIELNYLGATAARLSIL